MTLFSTTTRKLRSASMLPLILLIVCSLYSGIVYAGDDVSVSLIARKVVPLSGGGESFEAADQAKPGELVEYIAEYRNVSKQAVRNLVASLPVPSGMVYQEGSAFPAGAAASSDGKNFGPLPLKRKIRLTSGREELRDVPLSQYRVLRWNLKQLEAGKSVAVKARMKIDNTGQAVTIRPN